MTDKAKHIKEVMDRYKQKERDTYWDNSWRQFKYSLEADVKNTIKEKYEPYADLITINDSKNKDYEKEYADALKLKGYMFDSLVFRYKEAREAQMRAEQLEGRKSGDDYDGTKAKNRANRDIMRFIMILDEALGAHE